MENISLAIATLLCIGFFGAKICQLIRLPSVTGYICAGLLVGPSGFNLISSHSMGEQLNHFTQIALMMIAFGIGEHLEISRLKSTAKKLLTIGTAEIFGTFAFVSLGSFIMIVFTDIGTNSLNSAELKVLACLLGAVSVATAPAATILVLRELHAAGPLTTTLMAIVAIDNGLAIMIFGIVMSVAHQLLSAESTSLILTLGISLFEIAGSLLLGIATGFIIDLINKKLRNDHEMLTIGLALVLLCGESARLFNLSPLLAGMAAGFTIVNRDHRDMRVFRALNSFEPPIYVLFFTLAGVHLKLSSLIAAGWLGLAYFFLRTFGKIAGSYCGARFSSSPLAVQRYLGIALMPQAGVAIGLVFLINGDSSLSAFSKIITPVVLAGVVLSELIGPVCTKIAVKMAGETNDPEEENKYQPLTDSTDNTEPAGVPLVPWVWKRLQIPLNQNGSVVFPATHMATGAALARIVTILAHYYKASPFAINIQQPINGYSAASNDDFLPVLSACHAEVANLGYELYCSNIIDSNISQAIISAARYNDARAIILGQSANQPRSEYKNILLDVLEHSPCPVISIKFMGILHTERILVPIINMRELPIVMDILRALAKVGQHKITMLRLLPSYEPQSILLKTENRMINWMKMEKMAEVVQCKAISTDSRLESILKESKNHDLVVMPAPTSQGIKRLFFGSLTENVALQCPKTMITVYDK